LGAKLKQRLGVVEVEAVKNRGVGLHRVGARAEVKDELYLVAVFEQPRKKLVAFELQRVAAAFEIAEFFGREAFKLIDNHNIIKAFLVEKPEHCTTDETSSSRDKYHIYLSCKKLIIKYLHSLPAKYYFFGYAPALAFADEFARRHFDLTKVLW